MAAGDPKYDVYLGTIREEDGGSSSSVTAENVTIADAGNYFTSTNVEGALQELGGKLITINSTLDTINGEVL